MRSIPKHSLEMDAELARLGRSETQIKLRIGELLDELFERGAHHELGFSSFEAYVVERCARSRSWGRETRGVARRIRELDLGELRGAIVSGQLSWSMAELLVRHATHENQADLLRRASESTVRAMQVSLKGKEPEAKDGDLTVRCTRWVSEQDLVMLHASRVLVEYLNGARASDETFAAALLGEGETTLQSIEERLGKVSIEARPFDATRIEAVALAMQSARHERTAAQDEPVSAPVLAVIAEDLPLPKSARGLDREIVRCCRDLARRNLEIGRLFDKVVRSRAWRTLGYSSLDRYATERVGLSLSSLEHRGLLARRAARYPMLGQAIDGGKIGYEAALLISRVICRWASDALVNAWIDRAERRTVKHLREEVCAVLKMVDLHSETSRLPPSEDDLEAAFDFERKVQSGELLRAYYSKTAGPQMSVTLAARDAGARPLQLTLSPELYAHWLNVEASLRDIAGPDVSFVSFLCASLWDTWLPFLEAWDDKWKQIYLRDRHVCTSPVCERHDVTPHHVVFAGHGGSDVDDNITSGCSWCHLEGIHRGRLRAEGDASSLRWVIGREPILVVRGREKMAVA